MTTAVATARQRHTYTSTSRDAVGAYLQTIGS